MKAPNPSLTAAEVGERLGYDRKTVIRRALAGELLYYDFGSEYRFDPDDVDAFIRARQRGQDQKNK